jgi:transposase
MASFGSCDLEHRGAICRRSSAPIPPATIASFAGVGLPYGAGSWTLWLLLMMLPYAAVQMIDTSIVRVHQHAACIARNKRQFMGRSRGGLTSKIHVVVDRRGLPVRLALSTGEAHDNRLAAKLLSRLKSGSILLADRGYDADWVRALVHQHGAWANIPPKSNRKEALSFSPYLYRARNLVERFFNKIKHCRRVATRRALRPKNAQPASSFSPPTAAPVT